MILALPISKRIKITAGEQKFVDILLSFLHILQQSWRSQTESGRDGRRWFGAFGNDGSVCGRKTRTLPVSLSTSRRKQAINRRSS